MHNVIGKGFSKFLSSNRLQVDIMVITGGYLLSIQLYRINMRCYFISLLLVGRPSIPGVSTQSPDRLYTAVSVGEIVDCGPGNSIWGDYVYGLPSLNNVLISEPQSEFLNSLLPILILITKLIPFSPNLNTLVLFTIKQFTIKEEIRTL